MTPPPPPPPRRRPLPSATTCRRRSRLPLLSPSISLPKSPTPRPQSRRRRRPTGDLPLRYRYPLGPTSPPVPMPLPPSSPPSLPPSSPPPPLPYPSALTFFLRRAVAAARCAPPLPALPPRPFSSPPLPAPPQRPFSSLPLPACRRSNECAGFRPPVRERRAGLFRASSTQNQLAGPCLGRRRSPLSGTTRHGRV